MDGACAHHLIERHAENWGDAGEMMEAWAAARISKDAIWVSVKDSLPPEGAEVSVITLEGRIVQAVKDRHFVGGWKRPNCMSWECLSMHKDDVKFWHPSVLQRPPEHGFAQAPEDAPWAKPLA